MAEIPALDHTLIPIEEQLACVTREIGMRERVYPRWVERQKYTAEKAARELAGMRAVEATLRKAIAGQVLL